MNLKIVLKTLGGFKKIIFLCTRFQRKAYHSKAPGQEVTRGEKGTEKIKKKLSKTLGSSELRITFAAAKQKRKTFIDNHREGRGREERKTKKV